MCEAIIIADGYAIAQISHDSGESDSARVYPDHEDVPALQPKRARADHRRGSYAVVGKSPQEFEFMINGARRRLAITGHSGTVIKRAATDRAPDTSR